MVPALFRLFIGEALPDHFRLLGLDRAELDRQTLSDRLRDGVEQFAHGAKFDEHDWARFSASIDRNNFV